MTNSTLPDVRATYRASCHCGAFILEAGLPSPVQSAEECNCSLCYKKGALWAMIGGDSDGEGNPAIRFLKGEPAALTTYTFGRKLFDHKFCPDCGISLFFTGHGNNPEVGLNLRALQRGQLDIWKLDISSYDGASLPPSRQPPKYTGPLPSSSATDDDDGKDLTLYTGSCHCGDIQIAALLKPLDTIPAVECDCSSCNRIGATWTYPPRARVVIHGEDRLRPYVWRGSATGAWAKTFCPSCGVFLHNQLQDLPPDRVAAMTPEQRAWSVGAAHLKPFNLRVLDGVSVRGGGDLKVSRAEMYTREPLYADPVP